MSAAQPVSMMFFFRPVGQLSDIHITQSTQSEYLKGSGRFSHPLKAFGPSLVAESILCATVRALPGDGIARHTPYIFFHAILADTEPAPALPAEGQYPAAAVANMMALFAIFPSIGRS